jgi:DNA-binding response OmpR family regulator
VSTGPAVRVLVVEDYEQLRDTLVRGLEYGGFAVAGAGSMREALEVPPEAYDLVVSDQRLGDALGTELFRVLQDQDPGTASRFLLMTGDEHDMDLPVGVPVLLKPFRIDELVAAVRLLRDGSAGPDGSTGSGSPPG